MGSHKPEHGHIIQVVRDVEAAATSKGWTEICEGEICVFSDAKTSSKDAKERSDSMRKLLIAVILRITFMVVEIIGGIKANSLTIMTDAAHFLSDVAAFAISLFSLWAAGWEATPQRSYGFFRIEILWLLAGILVYEAIARLIHDTREVNGHLMFAVAAFDLIVNIGMAVLLGHDHVYDHSHDDHDQGAEATHQEPLRCPSIEDSKNSSNELQKKKKQRNINVQGAYLHVLGDSIQSVGVMIVEDKKHLINCPTLLTNKESV